ncbi:PAS domain-containing protein [Streptomyces sp. TRM68367]|nr:PAS domain-containing protein [Streptomyces sp. TRM68367]
MSPDVPFDDVATARAVIGADGMLTAWNEGARRLLGHTAAEVVGRPAVHPLADDGAGPLPASGQARWSGTLSLRHRDGHAVSVWVLAHRRQPEGDGPGDWLTVTPVSGKVPQQQDDPLVRAAVMQSPCATLVFDERLRLRGVNDAMAALLDLPAEHILGLRAVEIGVHPQTRELETHMRRVLATGRPAEMHAYAKAAGESHAQAWLSRITPLTDGAGRVWGTCVTAHDLTEQYLARERLQLVNQASVRIGSTLDVSRTAQELADVCVPALADFVSVDLLDPPANDGGPTGPPATPIGLRRAAHQSVNPGTPEAVAKPGQLGDVDASHELLCAALSGSTDSLDETCDRVLHALLPPGGAADDVALLVARTRGLPASQVATWDIPADPALVAPIRKQVVEQLGVWALTEASFTAELVVSELVTNAIRYGSHRRPGARRRYGPLSHLRTAGVRRPDGPGCRAAQLPGRADQHLRPHLHRARLSGRRLRRRIRQAARPGPAALPRPLPRHRDAGAGRQRVGGAVVLQPGDQRRPYGHPGGAAGDTAGRAGPAEGAVDGR